MPCVGPQLTGVASSKLQPRDLPGSERVTECKPGIPKSRETFVVHTNWDVKTAPVGGIPTRQNELGQNVNTVIMIKKLRGYMKLHKEECTGSWNGLGGRDRENSRKITLTNKFWIFLTQKLYECILGESRASNYG
ncbi:unnamed protein product, partial [marine sediment metagenome]